jgi:hypothetical protein
MAVLSYNGVTLRYCLTRDVAYEPVMSPDEQDYLYTRITISCQGYVSLDAPGATLTTGGAAAPAPVNPNGNPTLTFVSAQHKLEQVRKKLSFSNDNVIVEADASTDVCNGPFPKVTSIQRIDGVNALLVGFTVTTYRFDCVEKGAGQKKPAYVSNRWREEETRDNQFLAKRVRSGKIVILGGEGQADLNTLKTSVVPKIPKNFVRQRCVFAIEESGLAMSYQIEDQEVIQGPPAPAVEADMRFVETSPWPGALRYGVCSIKLKGSKETNPANLVLLGVTQAVQRLRAAGLNVDQNNQNNYAAELSITHVTASNTVEVMMRAQLKNYGGQGKDDPKDFSHFKLKPWPENISGTPEFPVSSNGLSLAAAEPTNALCDRDQVSLKRQLPANANPRLKNVNGQGPAPARGNLKLAALSEENSFLAQVFARQNGGSVPSPSQSPGEILEGTTYIVPVAPPIPENTAVYVSGGAYTYYRVEPTFYTDEGVAEMPGTNDDAEVAFVQFKQKSVRLVITWAAERTGQAPEIPQTDLQAESKPVLLKSELMTGQLESVPGNATAYRLAGRYEYGFKLPKKILYNAAVTPWTRDVMVAMGGSIASLFLNQQAASAVSNVSDQIISVATITTSPGAQATPFNPSPGASLTNTTNPAVPPPPNA